MKRMHLCNDSMRHNWHVAWRQLFLSLTLSLRLYSSCRSVLQCREKPTIYNIRQVTNIRIQLRFRFMWLLRVVSLDRHNIWDLHGCRSHTTFWLYFIVFITFCIQKLSIRLENGHSLHLAKPKWSKKANVAIKCQSHRSTGEKSNSGLNFKLDIHIETTTKKISSKLVLDFRILIMIEIKSSKSRKYYEICQP